jgi:hypothetical protein
VIATLAEKAEAFDREAEELSCERRGLLLDAELGISGAAKRLTKLDDEIAHRTREATVKREAIQQARSRLEEAHKLEAEAAEQRRRARMSALAAEAVLLAKEFDFGLTHAVEAGSKLSGVLTAMSAQASGEHELGVIRRLSQRGPYQRACENAGLRRYIEFAPYPGLKKDIVPRSEAAQDGSPKGDRM